jgi:hypothetical protein
MSVSDQGIGGDRVGKHNPKLGSVEIKSQQTLARVPGKRHFSGEAVRRCDHLGDDLDGLLAAGPARRAKSADQSEGRNAGLRWRSAARRGPPTTSGGA